MTQRRRYNHQRTRVRQRRMIACAFAVLIVIVFAIVLVRISASRQPQVDVPVAQDVATQTTAEPTVDVPNPTAEIPAQGAADQEPPVADDAQAAAVATADTGKKKQAKLPIISHKKDETDRICITIDDCFDEKYMRAIIKLAQEYDCDLTFFPKGQTIKKNAEMWKSIYELGYQIENHSYHHSNVSSLNEEKLRNTITMSEQALNEALGVNYHMSMFRCPTGDGMKDPRLHNILDELGYKAVASWGLSGTRDAKETLRLAKPGQLLLFHATKKDYERLKVVIPGLAKKGFKMVNVNTLYGKGPNQVTPLDTYDH